MEAFFFVNNNILNLPSSNLLTLLRYSDRFYFQSAKEIRILIIKVRYKI